MSPYLIFKIILLTILIVILIVVLLSNEKNRHADPENESQENFKDNAIGKTETEEKDEFKLLWLWDEWKKVHPDVMMVPPHMFGYGSNTDYQFILNTIKK